MKSLTIDLFFGAFELPVACATEAVVRELIESVLKNGAQRHYATLDDDDVVIEIDGCWCPQFRRRGAVMTRCLIAELRKNGKRLVVATECACDLENKIAFAEEVGADCIFIRRKDARDQWPGEFYRRDSDGKWNSPRTIEQKAILSGKR